MSADAGPKKTGYPPVVPARRTRLGPEEFARLYEEHWRLLWCAAASVVRDRTLAQDIVQQSALIALERLDQFDPATSFTAWMTTIVRNTALNESRKRGRRRTGQAESGALDSSPSRELREPSASLSSQGQMIDGHASFDDRLLEALNALEETARACLLMRVVADMPYRQIAIALSIPEGTAASHVHRCRAVLRSALREDRPAGLRSAS